MKRKSLHVQEETMDNASMEWRDGAPDREGGGVN